MEEPPISLKNLLIAKGYSLDKGWLSGCYAHVLSTIPPNAVKSDILLASHIQEYVHTSPLEESSNPCLPPIDPRSTEVVTVGPRTGAVLEVKEVTESPHLRNRKLKIPRIKEMREELKIPEDVLRDIQERRSKYQAKRKSNRPKKDDADSNNMDVEDEDLSGSLTLQRHTLRLVLTDGVTDITAVEIRKLDFLSLYTPIGFKIRVRNAEVRRGILFLNTSNTTPLGGGTLQESRASRLDRLEIMFRALAERRTSTPLEGIYQPDQALSRPRPPPDPRLENDNNVEVEELLRNNGRRQAPPNRAAPPPVRPLSPPPILLPRTDPPVRAPAPVPTAVISRRDMVTSSQLAVTRKERTSGRVENRISEEDDGDEEIPIPKLTDLRSKRPEVAAASGMGTVAKRQGLGLSGSNVQSKANWNDGFDGFDGPLRKTFGNFPQSAPKYGKENRGQVGGDDDQTQLQNSLEIIEEPPPSTSKADWTTLHGPETAVAFDNTWNDDLANIEDDDESFLKIAMHLESDPQFGCQAGKASESTRKKTPSQGSNSSNKGSKKVGKKVPLTDSDLDFAAPERPRAQSKRLMHSEEVSEREKRRTSLSSKKSTPSGFSASKLSPVKESPPPLSTKRLISSPQHNHWSVNPKRDHQNSSPNYDYLDDEATLISATQLEARVKSALSSKKLVRRTPIAVKASGSGSGSGNSGSTSTKRRATSADWQNIDVIDLNSSSPISGRKPGEMCKFVLSSEEVSQKKQRPQSSPVKRNTSIEEITLQPTPKKNSTVTKKPETKKRRNPFDIWESSSPEQTPKASKSSGLEFDEEPVGVRPKLKSFVEFKTHNSPPRPPPLSLTLNDFESVGGDETPKMRKEKLNRGDNRSGRKGNQYDLSATQLPFTLDIPFSALDDLDDSLDFNVNSIVEPVRAYQPLVDQSIPADQSLLASTPKIKTKKRTVNFNSDATLIECIRNPLPDPYSESLDDYMGRPGGSELVGENGVLVPETLALTFGPISSQETAIPESMGMSPGGNRDEDRDREITGEIDRMMIDKQRRDDIHDKSRRGNDYADLGEVARSLTLRSADELPLLAQRWSYFATRLESQRK
ncbi:hypothetical protein HDU97_008823 [Phlyctochytrium planicorne]|nr:hypothetical protein HDU97_008823 [Phlyctochytrium planicorne]